MFEMYGVNYVNDSLSLSLFTQALVRIGGDTMRTPRSHRARLFLLLICTIAAIFTLQPLLNRTVPQNIKNTSKDTNQVRCHIQGTNAKENGISPQKIHAQDYINSDQNINQGDAYRLSFRLKGAVFTDKGGHREIVANMTSSLIHSFTPAIEILSQRSFLDPAGGNTYYANAPAIMWHNGTLLAVLRIWTERQKYDMQKRWPINNFYDNVLFTLKYDRNMRPITHGQHIGLQTPKFTYGDGPLEPRLFKHKGEVYVSFNVGLGFGDTRVRDVTVFWNYYKNYYVVPKLKGGTKIKYAKEPDIRRDKHWSPFEWNEKLYFVYSLDPFRVISCSIHEQEAKCKFINGDIIHYDDTKMHLRGGTPFERYNGSYFISIAHGTFFTKNTRVYTTHLVVMATTPVPRIVYVSADLHFHQYVLTRWPLVRHIWMKTPFLFPVGLIIENEDTIAIGAHVNDYGSVLVRMRNMKELMQKVIEMDSSKIGPPDDAIQNYVFESVCSEKNVQFLN